MNKCVPFPAVVFAVALAACSQAVLITGDGSGVSVQYSPDFYESAIQKAADLARGHCGGFGKKAVFLDRRYVAQSTSIAYFECR